MGARSHLRQPVMLCGTMFGLGVDNAELQRHRLFETNWPLLLTPQCNHGARDTIGLFGGHARNRRRGGRVIGVYGHGPFDSINHKGRGGKDAGQPDFSVAQGRVAMETPWMSMQEMSQAIPPAYSEYIARKWLDQR